MADHNDSPVPQAMRTGNRWDTLRFYRKSDALYQLTFFFCERFLPKHGDRTGYRKGQDERLRQLETENASLKQQVAQWRARYEDLKQRALVAYYRQQ